MGTWLLFGETKKRSIHPKPQYHCYAQAWWRKHTAFGMFLSQHPEKSLKTYPFTEANIHFNLKYGQGRKLGNDVTRRTTCEMFIRVLTLILEF